MHRGGHETPTSEKKETPYSKGPQYGKKSEKGETEISTRK